MIRRPWISCSFVSALAVAAIVTNLEMHRKEGDSIFNVPIPPNDSLNSQIDVLSILSFVILSTLFVDITLWVRRTFLGDKSSLEIVIYPDITAGEKIEPVSSKQKWFVFYPGLIFLVSVGWYAIYHRALGSGD